VLKEAMIHNNQTICPQFGDIYFADLKADGHVQGGRRPVIVLQNNIGNLYSPTLFIVPLSSQTDKANYMPTHVIIKAEMSGLPRDSIALFEQMRTINKNDLFGNKISNILNNGCWSQVKKAASVQCPLFC